MEVRSRCARATGIVTVAIATVAVPCAVHAGGAPDDGSAPPLALAAEGGGGESWTSEIDWRLIVAILALLVASGGLVNAQQAKKQAREHERSARDRERRAAALELWITARDDLQASRRAARAEMKKMNDAGGYDQNEEVWQYLGRLEQIAVGINEGLYDQRALLRLLSRRVLVADAELFAPYIEERRKRKNRHTIYREFTDLVDQISREEPDD